MEFQDEKNWSHEWLVLQRTKDLSLINVSTSFSYNIE